MAGLVNVFQPLLARIGEGLGYVMRVSDSSMGRILPGICGKMGNDVRTL